MWQRLEIPLKLSVKFVEKKPSREEAGKQTNQQNKHKPNPNQTK